MIGRMFSVALIAALFTLSAEARPLYLFGNIGPASVVALLENDDGVLRGYYFYRIVGKELELEGKIDASGAFMLDEKSGGAKTGRFVGAMKDGVWSGEWRKPDGGSPLAFSFAEPRSGGAALDGSYRCSSIYRDAQYGWTYKTSLTLKVAKGAVKGFDAGLDEQSAQDGSQGCFYNLKDFHQAETDIGLLLTAKDVDDPVTEDSQRCSIRVVGDDKTLFVEFGDLTAKNDDCRFSGTTAFCSPRSSMGNIVVDRAKGACKALSD